MTILRPYPIRGCALWTQHFDDCNDMGMLPDHGRIVVLLGGTSLGRDRIGVSLGGEIAVFDP